MADEERSSEAPAKPADGDLVTLPANKAFELERIRVLENIKSEIIKMSNNSLQDFLAENDIASLKLEDELDLPSIDSDFFRDGDFEPTSTDDQGRLDKKNPVTCPECGHEFIP